mgnify:CR=1 FL=1
MVSMNVQYKDAIFHPVIALIMVKMPIQSTLQTVVFNKRKLLYTKIQTILDQAMIFNTDFFFEDCCWWIDLYNKMVKSYGTCNFNEQPAQFWFDRLKTDQDLPVYYVVWGGIMEETIAKRATISM